MCHTLPLTSLPVGLITASGDIEPRRSFIVYRIGLILTTSDILSTTSDIPNKPNKF